ncbi:hypothetical protein NQ318_017887 [Aromia moschata]|uniref:Uncharacterized protein n=1 Tax=Aromia moschata TaxID=1265417 RepID=A0AAV8YCW5_9CUCU|nr:hypothetical protein NQ318_017887 [Aromia moschata]
MMRLAVFSAVVAVAFGAYTGDPKVAQILRSESDISPEGNYQFAYETENGISASAQGTLKQVGTESALVAQGAFQWADPEGQLIQVQYVADENGYQPVGDALPTPPPVPVAIARALEYIRAHPSAPEPGFARA